MRVCDITVLFSAEFSGVYVISLLNDEVIIIILTRTIFIVLPS